MKYNGVQPPIGVPISRNHPLSQGCIGSWLLNETGGLKAIDSSYNHNNGTLTVGTFTNKQKGSCFTGNGTSSYIALGTTTNLNLPGVMTISAWIQPTNINAGTKQVVCNSNGAGTLVQWNLEINRTAGKVSMLANSAGVAVTSNTSLVAGSWHHIVGSRSGSTGAWTYKVYINGRLDNTATGVTGNPDAHQVDAIGDIGNSGGQWFNGQIKNVMIWNRTLTGTEVAQLYAQPYCMYEYKSPTNYAIPYRSNLLSVM